MDPQKMLQADYLDIIFDNRNKNYGGYELRKNYNRRMKKAGLFALLGASAVLSFSFIAVHSNVRVMPTGSGKVIDVVTVILPPPPVTPPPVKPLIQPPPPAAKTAILTTPVITREEIKPEEQMSTIKELTNATPGLRTNDTGNNEYNNTGISGTGPVTSVAVVPAKGNAIPVWVEQMPSFPGDMSKFLGNMLRYPETARAANVQGRVLVQFVVNEDGSISNIKVERGIGGGCDEEAARVVGAMPKWKPGRQNNTAVKVLYKIPIKFQLD